MKKLIISFLIGLCFIWYFFNLTTVAYLIGFATISFLQNAVFTVVSRSRNSGNTKLHKKVAYLSNGIWYCNQVFMIGMIWKFLIANPHWYVVGIAGIVYILFTAHGSAFGMKMWAKHVETRDESYKVGAALKE